MKRLTATIIAVVLFASSAVSASNPWDDLVLDQPATIEFRRFAAIRDIARRVTDPPPPPIPADWQCVEWYEVSIEAGFTHDDWPAVGIIAWRESRCNPAAFNGRDPSGGSRGIMQVNGSWRSWLRDRGIITHVTDLHDPLTNMRAARAIVQYDRDRGRCSWTQWSTKRGLC